MVAVYIVTHECEANCRMSRPTISVFSNREQVARAVMTVCETYDYVLSSEAALQIVDDGGVVLDEDNTDRIRIRKMIVGVHHTSEFKDWYLDAKHVSIYALYESSSDIT